MISAVVELLRPDTLGEAASAYAEASAAGLNPHYYAGGTELVALARTGKVQPEVLIDLKCVPECRQLGSERGEVVFGSALSLNEIAEANLFPLLSAAAVRVADHTVRNRLSLGGNIAGRLPYRETVLPLLAADAVAELYGPDGGRRIALSSVFSRRLELAPGEFLVRVRVAGEAASSRFYHGRRERGTRVDYPLVTVCLLAGPTGLGLGVTGACGYPQRLAELEGSLQDESIDSGRRARAVSGHLRGQIRGDFRASAEYRGFLLETLVGEGLDQLFPRAGRRRHR
jgi:CO/xanthine dehydrogenase FAD-binding subunit